jgi:hypothetical protein
MAHNQLNKARGTAHVTVRIDTCERHAGCARMARDDLTRYTNINYDILFYLT